MKNLNITSEHVNQILVQELQIASMKSKNGKRVQLQFEPKSCLFKVYVDRVSVFETKNESIALKRTNDEINY